MFKTSWRDRLWVNVQILLIYSSMVNLRQICPTRKPFLLLRRDPYNTIVSYLWNPQKYSVGSDTLCTSQTSHYSPKPLQKMADPPILHIPCQHIYASLVHFGHMRAMKFPAICYISYLKQNAHSYCSCRSWADTLENSYIE